MRGCSPQCTPSPTRACEHPTVRACACTRSLHAHVRKRSEEWQRVGTVRGAPFDPKAKRSRGQARSRRGHSHSSAIGRSVSVETSGTGREGPAGGQRIGDAIGSGRGRQAAPSDRPWKSSRRHGSRPHRSADNYVATRAVARHCHCCNAERPPGDELMGTLSSEQSPTYRGMASGS